MPLSNTSIKHNSRQKIMNVEKPKWLPSIKKLANKNNSHESACLFEGSYGIDRCPHKLMLLMCESWVSQLKGCPFRGTSDGSRVALVLAEDSTSGQCILTAVIDRAGGIFHNPISLQMPVCVGKPRQDRFQKIAGGIQWVIFWRTLSSSEEPSINRFQAPS